MDDDPSVLGTLERVLRSNLYDIVTARSPEKALEFVANIDDRLKLLITDFMMPGTNGIGLVAAARAIKPELRALYISGMPLPGHEAMTIEKPYDLGELRERVLLELAQTLPPSS